VVWYFSNQLLEVLEVLELGEWSTNKGPFALFTGLMQCDECKRTCRTDRLEPLRWPLTHAYMCVYIPNRVCTFYAITMAMAVHFMKCTDNTVQGNCQMDFERGNPRLGWHAPIFLQLNLTISALVWVCDVIVIVEPKLMVNANTRTLLTGKMYVYRCWVIKWLSNEKFPVARKCFSLFV
jgi:hypothetical protein